MRLNIFEGRNGRLGEGDELEESRLPGLDAVRSKVRFVIRKHAKSAENPMWIKMAAALAIE